MIVASVTTNVAVAVKTPGWYQPAEEVSASGVPWLLARGRETSLRVLAGNLVTEDDSKHS